jgi:hypothetical protein
MEFSMANYRVYYALAAIMISGLLLYPVLVGGSSTVPDEQLQEIVYVDRETGEAFLLRARSSPEYHPETGDPTLIPGMYCEKCRAWKPVGPLEVLQASRVPHKCPIHKTPLLREGPLPDDL